VRNAELQCEVGERGRIARSQAERAIPHSAFHIPHFEVHMTDLPYRVEKPWGHELIWARTDRYVGKILHIEPGHVLSLQYHNKKDESIYVLTGEIILRIQQGDTLIERPISQGAAFHIEPKVIHQFEAVVPTDLLEASTPEIDDVVRLKDRYGRV
jgi:mannose-6-phosphate isomerase-like protein (cupin superfamily)